MVALQLGNRQKARALVEEAMLILNRYEDPWARTMSVTLLGHVELADGNIDCAEKVLTDSVGLHEAIGNPLYLSWSLEGLAGVAAARGEWQRTAHLGGARDAFRERLGFPLPSLLHAYTTMLANARAALLDEAFSAAYEAGRVQPESAIVSDRLRGSRNI